MNVQLKTYEIGARLLIEARKKLLLANVNQLAQLELAETANYIDNRTWIQVARPYCIELRWYNYDTHIGNTLSLASRNCEQFQGTPIHLQEYTFSPTSLPSDEKKKAAYEATYLLLFVNDIFRGINFPWSIWKYSNGVNILI